MLTLPFTYGPAVIHTIVEACELQNHLVECNISDPHSTSDADKAMIQDIDLLIEKYTQENIEPE